MKSILYYGKGDIRLEEQNIPEIGPKDVLIKSKYASICGSDLHPYRRGRQWAKACPQIFGHEYAASIAEVGSEVTKYKVGDRVFGCNIKFCGECYYCKKGDFGSCINVADHYTGQGIPGAFAQYFKFTNPEDPNAFAPYLNSLIKIPDEMTDEQAAMMEPFGIGLGAVEGCDVKAGDIVVVLGTGIIGNSTMQWCKARGATVVSVGRSARRLECAKECGADYIIDNSKGDCYNQIAKIFGETGWYWGKEATPVDIVIDCAGYPESVNDALKIVRPGGTVCLVALYEDNANINPQFIMSKMPKLFGSGANDILGSMKGIIDGTVKVEPLLDEIVPIGRFHEAFDRQLSGSAVKVLIDMN